MKSLMLVVAVFGVQCTLLLRGWGWTALLVEFFALVPALSFSSPAPRRIIGASRAYGELNFDSLLEPLE